jgi:sodium/hydrogen antiporter
LLGLPWPVALVAGACLASTDAVTLRDVLRDDRLAPSVRRALAVEAGSNDLIVLPALLVLIAIAAGSASTVAGWASFLAQLLLAGPVVGGLVGWGGATLMGRIAARSPVREEYQSLYGIGLVLLAYVAGELVGGSGFLAAFAAGVAVNRANHDLCDCFLDFGQNLAEVLLLIAFVLFGAVLSGPLLAAPLAPSLAVALLAVLVVRPVAVGGSLALRRAVLSGPARLVIAWFGPRGLASLLLAVLAVGSAVPQGELLLTTVGWVVVVSVILHGVSATPVAAWYGRRAAAVTLPEAREGEGVDVLVDRGAEAERLDVVRLAEDQSGPAPWTVVDVRTPAAREADPEVIPASVVVSPEDLRSYLDVLPGVQRLAFWCTCSHEATAARAARRATAAGHTAVAVRGGLDAWRDAGLPVDHLAST